MDRPLFRANARYTDSRLYRQSAEQATELLVAPTAETPLEVLAPIAFAGANNLTLREPRQFDRPIRQLATHLTGLARSGSAYHFLPTLHEAVARHYTGPGRSDRPSWLGPGLKLAAGHLWTEMMAGRAVGGCSNQLLRDTVLAAGALDQALSLQGALAATVGEGEVRVSTGVMEWNEPFTEVLQRLDRVFSLLGAVQRVAPQLEDIVLNDFPVLVALAAERLQGGTTPLRDSHGQLLQVLSGVHDREFWEGVFCRLLMLGASIDARKAVGAADSMIGVAVLGKPKISIKGMSGSERSQETMESLFWQQDWRSGLGIAELRSAFVGRPIMHIDAQRPVFVTSGFTIMDSLTMLIEDNLPNLQVQQDSKRSESAYRLLVSEPFERDVIDQLRSRDMLAGTVTSAGGWLCQGDPIDLRSIAGDRPPGEIDVLAVLPDVFAVVIECKCLKLPHTYSRLDTLLKTLGDEDHGEFLTNLDEKAAWVRQISHIWQVPHVERLLVTDQPYNFRPESNRTSHIVDADSFFVAVDDLLQERRGK